MDYVIQATYSDLESYGVILDTYPVNLEITDFAYPTNYGLEGEKLVELWKASEYYERIVGVHGSYFDLNLHSVDHQIAQITKKRYLWNLGVADQLNAGYCIFHTNYQPEHHNRRYLERWLHAHRQFIQQVVTNYATIPILENMRDPSPSNLELLTSMLSEDKYGICLDVAHVHSYSDIPFVDWLARLKNRVQLVHLKDRNQPKQELALGQGTINWDNILPPIFQASLSYMVVEMDTVDKITASLDYILNYQ